MDRRQAIVGAAALGLIGAAPAARRVVSLNPCLDAILVAVAQPEQIAALSHWSREPDGSSVPLEVARRFGVTHEGAEEIIALSPDLVLASNHSDLATRNALKRLGVPVMLFRTPDTIAESLDQTLRIAHAVGRGPRGRAVAAGIQDALAAAAPPPGAPRLRALVFQRNGFSSGPGTLMDELLTRTGFDNAIVGYGVRRTSNVPLEQVLADPPQVLLRGAPHPGYPGWGERIMRHPALERVRGRMRIVFFPERLMHCGGPNLVESAARLAAARDRALEAT